jgi:hypothetical protein
MSNIYGAYLSASTAKGSLKASMIKGPVEEVNKKMYLTGYKTRNYFVSQSPKRTQLKSYEKTRVKKQKAELNSTISSINNEKKEEIETLRKITEPILNLDFDQTIPLKNKKARKLVFEQRNINEAEKDENESRSENEVLFVKGEKFAKKIKN